MHPHGKHLLFFIADTSIVLMFNNPITEAYSFIIFSNNEKDMPNLVFTLLDMSFSDYEYVMLRTSNLSTAFVHKKRHNSLV